MTGPERQDLKIALDFLREWRDDDREWKATTDRRLAKLESRNVAQDAVASAARDVASEARLSRRWRIGLALSVSATLILGLANFALKLAGQ